MQRFAIFGRLGEALGLALLLFTLFAMIGHFSTRSAGKLRRAIQTRPRLVGAARAAPV